MGSGIEGSIVAAAYLITSNQKIHQYLGGEQTTNVYAAELTRIQIAMQSMKECPRHYSQCNIYADNQAAITAILQPGQQSGQYILHNIHDNLEKIQEDRLHLSFHIE